jgi:hypothetical protein
MFSARFPVDMMRHWAGDETGSLYERCDRALKAAKLADAASYDRLFGAVSAVSAAKDLAAMRYGFPGDARRALEYGPEIGGNPVASVVACLLDAEPMLFSSPTRLVDRDALMTEAALAPIARAAQVLFCYDGQIPPGGFVRPATLAAVASAAELGVGAGL